MKINNISFNFDTKVLTLDCDTEGSKITKICIDTQDTFSCKNSASDIALVCANPGEGSQTIDLSDNEASYLLENENLLFVYIYTKEGDGDSIVNKIIPIHDSGRLYKVVYDKIRNDFNGCDCCIDFDGKSVEYVYAFYGLMFALNSGNLRDACNLWKVINGTNVTLRKCGC